MSIDNLIDFADKFHEVMYGNFYNLGERQW